jgi:hypothetical protein
MFVLEGKLKNGIIIASVADPDLGSGAIFDPFIRDPGWVKNLNPDSE